MESIEERVGYSVISSLCALHNCQNTERTPQTQQFKQDEETEEYPADKGTG